jgi:hypothetical protein
MLYAYAGVVLVLLVGVLTLLSGTAAFRQHTVRVRAGGHRAAE